jgi:HD superfamily phosphodiesterase
MDNYRFIEESIIKQLKELPFTYYFHNYNHALDVITQVERIAEFEKVSNLEKELLKTAALFHDTGFLADYHNHEEKSAKIAQQVLKLSNYSENNIQIIMNMILSTKIPQNPQNILEKILCDADLDNLGRADFIEKNELLRQELYDVKNQSYTDSEWYLMTLKLLEQHRYFTSAQKEREDFKMLNYNLVVQELNKVRHYNGQK